MWRIVLLVSLVPTVLAIIARKFFCDRGVMSAGNADTSRTGRELAERLLAKAGIAEKVEIVEKRRAEVVVGKKTVHLQLPGSLQAAKNVVALGEVALLCGHALVAVKNPDLLKWRQWAVRFSWALPVFTLVVLVFAVVATKLPPVWAIAAAVGSLGLGSAFSLVSVQVESQAAKMMATLIDESRIFPRLKESEAVALCCRSLAFRQVVPGAIEWLMSKDMERRIAQEVGKQVVRKMTGR